MTEIINIIYALLSLIVILMVALLAFFMRDWYRNRYYDELDRLREAQEEPVGDGSLLR